MLKQNIFVLLSSLLAAATVFGWMDVTTPEAARERALGEQSPVRVDSPNMAVAEAMSALNQTSDKALKALADAAVQANLAEIVAAPPTKVIVEPEPAVKAPSGRPSRSKDKKEPEKEEVPEIDPNAVYQEALEALKVTDILKDARALALINIADGSLLAATNDESANAFLARPGRKSTLTGTDYSIVEDALESWSWFCLSKSGKLCIAGSFVNAPRVSSTDGCISASKSTGVVCGEQSLVGSRIFNGENCNLSQYPNTSTELPKIQGFQTQSGVSDGLIFSKQALSADCTLISAIPESSVNVLSDEAILQSEKDFRLWRGIFSFAAALIVLIFGVICTRRRENHESEEKHKEEIHRWEVRESTLHSKLTQLSKEIKELEIERDRLKDKTYDLQKDKDDSEKACSRLLSENAIIKEQLDVAKQNNRESSLTIQSLEVETASLRDKLASSDHANGSNKTLVTNYPQNKNSQSSLGSRTEIMPSLKAPDDDDMNGKTDPPTFMPSSPTRPVSESNFSKNADGTSRTDHNLKSLLTFEEKSEDSSKGIMDDTWDEIADSFDSIIAFPNKSQNKGLDFSAATIPSAPAPNLLANTSPTQPDAIPDAGSTATHLLGALRQQAGEISQLPDRRPAVTAPVAEPLSTSINSQPRMTTQERSPFSPSPSTSNAGAPVSKSTDGIADSFKPSPSWSGRKINDSVPEVSAVSQELVNALQRRARDVSQLNASVSRSEAEPQTTSNRSGALNFNRSMSRSGMFSLTGSRSKISLKTEADKTYFNDLFDKYIESMRQNGEPTKYTREQFISRMAKEKDTLMAKFQCSDVTFTIYTKDGKTSLKAIPKK